MTVPIHNLTDTWNDGGTTFTAIRMNVTDTASHADSLLMDLQVGGASRFSVRKDGLTTLASDLFLLGNRSIITSGAANGRLTFEQAGVSRFRWDVTGFLLSANRAVAWISTNSFPGTEDLLLHRDAADTLAQRRAANAQASRIYRTFTDTSNRAYFETAWSGDHAQLRTVGQGTGTRGNIVLDGANRAAYSETPADIAAALVSHGIMAPA